MEIDLNCDLGEGCAFDAELMPLITSANVACGFHAGDPATAALTIHRAKQLGVQVGAHPGFSDREHFGRLELERTEQQVFEDCVYQLGALAGLARAAGWPLRYVKPHGALYNLACRDSAYARPVVAAVQLFELAVMGLPRSRLQADCAGKADFIAEGFADRRYQPDGALVPRSHPDAFVEDPAEAVRQVEWLLRDQGIRTVCVHGDNPKAVQFVRTLREVLLAQGFQISGLLMSLYVISPGLCSRIVDAGRQHCRSLGVPVGGAADRTSLSLGNALVGNPPDSPALEISLAGPALRATCSVAGVVFGAPFVLSSVWQTLHVGTTFTLRAGERLDMSGTPSGMRAYLCVRGGFKVKAVLKSRSSLHPIQAGAELTCTSSTIPRRSVQSGLQWNEEPRVLHALDGPQADWFRPGEFFAQQFLVTPASDRMGLRLRGVPLSLSTQELASEPVCPGSVQVTRDGQPIVLGVDGQTIGGYPKVAQVIAADLDKLGQLRPGDSVRFRHVTLDQAEHIYRDKQAELHDWLTRLRTAEVFP